MSIYDLLFYLISTVGTVIVIILIAKGSRKYFGVDIFKDFGINTNVKLSEITTVLIAIVIIMGILIFAQGANTTITNQLCTNPNISSTNRTICNVLHQNQIAISSNNTVPNWYNATKEAQLDNVTLNIQQTVCGFLCFSKTVKPELVSLSYECYYNRGVTLSVTESVMVDSYNLNYTSYIATIRCTTYGDNTYPFNYTVSQSIYK